MDYFIDETRLEVEAGKGGNGCIAFRREKYVEFGGPNGGDGGNGGNIYVRGDKGIQTLARFKDRYHLKAKKGGNGEGKGLHGKRGEDLIITAPLGTVVYDEDTGQILADIKNVDDLIMLAKGGNGGRGNTHFKSSTNRAPEIAEKGTQGQVRRIKLELKILADVGLIGFPNAGKSTLITSISGSHSQVAAYPFSTLRPFLGVVKISDWQQFVMADIPGIIEGASEGKGIGIRFLKHIERSKVHLFIIDLFSEDPSATFFVLKKELENYNSHLLNRPYLVALNKADGFPLEEVQRLKGDFLQKTKIEPEKLFVISALKKSGLKILVETLYDLVEKSEYSNPLTKNENEDIFERNWKEELETRPIKKPKKDKEEDIEIFWEFAEGSLRKQGKNKKFTD